MTLFRRVSNHNHSLMDAIDATLLGPEEKQVIQDIRDASAHRREERLRRRSEQEQKNETAYQTLRRARERLTVQLLQASAQAHSDQELQTFRDDFDRNWQQVIATARRVYGFEATYSNMVRFD